jgi:hypothetical protein
VSPKSTSVRRCSLLLGLLALAVSSSATTFDAFTDFQIASNSSTNTWSYWSDGTTNLTNYNSMIVLMPTPSLDCGFGTSCWFNAADNSVILQNATGSVANFLDGGAAPNGLLTYYPRLSTSVIRFTAPSSGTYSISGDFNTLSSSPSPTQFAVVLNGTTFLDDSSSLGSFPFSSVLSLSSGNTLDFIVAGGDCSNSGCNQSATSFDATLSNSTAPVPEPETLLLLVSGLFGLGGVIRKKLLTEQPGM